MDWDSFNLGLICGVLLFGVILLVIVLSGTPRPGCVL